MDSSPKEIFTANIPAAREMADFLFFPHIFYFFHFIAFNIEVDGPVSPSLTFSETIIFKAVYHTVILPSINFVPQLSIVESPRLGGWQRLVTYWGVEKEHSRWSTVILTFP